MALKQDGVHFFLCPKQGNKIEVVVQNRVWDSNPKRLTYIQIFGTSGSHYMYSSLNCGRKVFIFNGYKSRYKR